ncbi:MAG TPA: hypothetical protein DCZ08_14330 [Anaerolineaceae bacterium]|nr:hypothetical protein [Anaerolineaceae bacterium]
MFQFFRLSHPTAVKFLFEVQAGTLIGGQRQLRLLHHPFDRIECFARDSISGREASTKNSSKEQNERSHQRSDKI